MCYGDYVAHQMPQAAAITVTGVKNNIIVVVTTISIRECE